jgi:NTP pyrophosphatase (non-canonical NTP hydrolase)
MIDNKLHIPQILIDTSHMDHGFIEYRALKLNEEAGEVAEVVLTYLGRKRGKGNLDTKIDHIVEECVDTIIMAMDILSCLGETNEDKLTKVFNKKLDKWKRKHLCKVT